MNSESEYVQQRISPPFQEWAALIVPTQPPVIESAGTTETAQPIDSATTVDALRRSARRRFIECAQAYVMRLTDLAERAGISLSRVPLLTGDPDQQPIVMTGHQPTIFHSGLTFKYEVTESFAVETNAIFAAVVIDTDAGDCGRFELPESVGDSVFDVAASARSLAAKHDPSLFLAVPMQSEDQLLQMSQVVDEQMKRLAARTSHRWMSGPGHVLREYAKLAGPDAGISMMDANLIMRWCFGIGARCLELPLSSIAAFPEVVALTSRLVCRGRSFSSEYNALLEHFRADHGIRNPANPFPDMRVDGESFELPFWVVDLQRAVRHPLVLKRAGQHYQFVRDGDAVGALLDFSSADAVARVINDLLLVNIAIVPRGAMITALLRILFSDLFVHGTGGGTYDPFTDRLIQQCWHQTPTPFTVASASRYLFPDLRRQLEKMDGVAGQMRDLQFNPQRYFDSDVFSDDCRKALQGLLQQKQAAVAGLKSAHSAGESAKAVGHQIQKLTDQIKQLVSDEMQPQMQILESLSSSARRAVTSRSYPWFCFVEGTET